MKLHEDMAVQAEIVENLFEEDFVTTEDSDIRLDLENKLEALGLDPDWHADGWFLERRHPTGMDPPPRLKPSGVEWLGETLEHWNLKGDYIR